MVKKIFVVALAAGLLGIPAAAQDRETLRLEEAATVLKEIMNVPDNIPQELIDKAECVIVVPGTKKGAFIFGGSYGRGAIICRSGENFNSAWGAPAMFRLYQGSFGLQIGGQETDFVMLIMNRRGANSIIGSKVRLGAEASVAGGPKGRTAAAATNEAMRAEVLTYSRARGVFAGLSLEGANLQQDNSANEAVYGRKLTARQIVRGGAVQPTAEGRQLSDFLNSKSPRNLSDPKAN
jgi:lipid-binding SYLF domain-containing protein